MKKRNKLLIYPFILLGLLLMLTINCKKTDITDYIPPPILKKIPVLTTSDISNITPSSATCGGDITSDGDTIVTARGVCWSTNQNPTISDSISSDGAGMGDFISNLKNLGPSTKYYVRAYATNGIGTGYGEVRSFTTLGGITDIDGNVYDTVTIGTQVWMVQNLKTTRLNDGSNIANITDNSGWSNCTTNAYCWYNNNIAAHKDPYGALYNWYTVNSGKLCPQGWHVPSYDEWLTLIMEVGNQAHSGGRLKEVGTAHWAYPNTGATNEYGFTALPGGVREDELGDFDYLTKYGGFWTSTQEFSHSSNYTMMNYDYEGISEGATHQFEYGLSVRCIKD